MTIDQIETITRIIKIIGVITIRNSKEKIIWGPVPIRYFTVIGIIEVIICVIVKSSNCASKIYTFFNSNQYN